MMLEGGGPNPFYAEGRVGLSISVLNGLIKCNKSVGVEVGERCFPSFPDPFGGIPIVAETYPTDGETEVSVFARPKITFSFPMDVITEIPTQDAQGNSKTEYIKPHIHSVEILNQRGNNYTINEETYLRNGKMLRLEKDQFKGSKDYKVKLKIRAKEYPYGPSGIEQDVIIEGSIWESDTTFVFTTGPADVLDDEGIDFMIPMRGQRYFLQDEGHSSTEKVNLNQETYIFKSNDNAGNYEYSYFVRYISENNDDVIEVDLPNVGSAIYSINWKLPTLELNTHYAVQIIRKATPLNNLGHYNLLANRGLLNLNGQIAGLNDENVEVGDNTYSSQDTMVLADAMSNLDKLGYGESVMYQYFFKTSKYNTLEDKLASATYGTNGWESGDVLKLNTNENFDKFDSRGLKVDGEHIVEPLIRLFDPMLKENRLFGASMGINTYTTFYDEKVDGRLWRLIDKWQIKGLDDEAWGDLPSLEMDYKDQMENALHKEVLNYDPPLDDDVENRFAESNYSSYISSGLVLNNYSVYQEQDVEIHFNTFEKTKSDANTLYEWAEDLYNSKTNFGTYIYRATIDNEYGKFSTHYNDIPWTSDFNSTENDGKKYYLDAYHGKFYFSDKNLKVSNKIDIEFKVE